MTPIFISTNYTMMFEEIDVDAVQTGAIIKMAKQLSEKSKYDSFAMALV